MLEDEVELLVERARDCSSAAEQRVIKGAGWGISTFGVQYKG